MKNYSIKFTLLIIALAQISVFAQTDKLENLFKNRQYFVLRDEVNKSSDKDAHEILFYRGVVANRFNEPQESIALLRKYIERAGQDAVNLADAHEILADSYTKTYEYGKAADIYKLLLKRFRDKLDAEKIKDYENVFGLWDALRNVPRQTVSFGGDSSVQGSRDKAKLLNVPVEINNRKMDFVFDTGANISTITSSTAAKLNLKIIESNVSVGSSTDKKVLSKLAVAPELKLGSVTVRNAVFLVLDDESLFFPQANYQINGIVGFPLIESFGRISFARNDQVFIAAKSKKVKAEPNMCLEGLTPLVAATYKNRRMIFAFDTGAVTSDFYPAFYKADEAEIRRLAATEKMKVGGAGGFTEVTAYAVKDLALTVGGRTARFAKARILLEPTNEDSRYLYGNLGQDLIKQFERMTLDFRAMRIDFE